MASAAFFFDASCCLSGGGLVAARGRKLKLHSMAAAILTYKVLPSGYKDVLKQAPQARVLKCEVWIRQAASGQQYRPLQCKCTNCSQHASWE